MFTSVFHPKNHMSRCTGQAPGLEFQPHPVETLIRTAKKMSGIIPDFRSNGIYGRGYQDGKGFLTEKGIS